MSSSITSNTNPVKQKKNIKKLISSLQIDVDKVLLREYENRMVFCHYYENILTEWKRVFQNVQVSISKLKISKNLSSKRWIIYKSS